MTTTLTQTILDTYDAGTRTFAGIYQTTKASPTLIYKVLREHNRPLEAPGAATAAPSGTPAQVAATVAAAVPSVEADATPVDYTGRVGFGDYVRCLDCDSPQMLVPLGDETCPRCGSKGTLTWVDEDHPEVDTADFHAMARGEQPAPVTLSWASLTATDDGSDYFA